MKRVTMLLLLLTGAGAAVAVTVSFLPTNRVDAQPPKARPQWEYARLVEGAAAADYIWSTGKTTLRAPAMWPSRTPTAPSENSTGSWVGRNRVRRLASSWT